MQQIECEHLGAIIQDHMKREVKELLRMQSIDDKLSFLIEEKDVKCMQEIRELHRLKLMVHRQWLKEIAPLMCWEVVKFAGRGHDKRTGIKIIVPTKFREW